MISLTLEYALRAVVTVAQRSDQPCTARQIADSAEIPLPYLSKLMPGLVRAGVVTSQRGIRGGFLLARDPAQLTIWDLAEIVDPVRRILTCPLKLGSHSIALCPLHRRIDSALAATEAVFRGTTIADLLAESAGDQVLCELRESLPRPQL